MQKNFGSKKYFGSKNFGFQVDPKKDVDFGEEKKSVRNVSVTQMLE